jgi:Predicted transcriptional regulators
MYVNRLKDLREDKDLFQKDIAKILNTTQQQYSRIETEENQLSYDGLIKLALFYNVSIDYLLGLTNISKPYPKNKHKGDYEYE